MKKALWISLLMWISHGTYVSNASTKESEATQEAAAILLHEPKPKMAEALLEPVQEAEAEVPPPEPVEPLPQRSPTLTPDPEPEAAVPTCGTCAAKYASMARRSKVIGPVLLIPKAIPIFGWEWALLEYFGRREVKETLAGALRPCFTGLDTIASHGILPAKNYQRVATILAEASAAVNDTKPLSKNTVLTSFYNDFLKRGYPETEIDLSTMVAYLDAINRTALAKDTCRYLYSREHLLMLFFNGGVLHQDKISASETELKNKAIELSLRETTLTQE